MTLYGWTYCRSCHAKIYWLKNERTGKLAPIDKDPAPDGSGNIEVEDGRGIYRVVGKGPGRHKNHFVTCPAAGVWRRHGGGMEGVEVLNGVTRCDTNARAPANRKIHKEGRVTHVAAAEAEKRGARAACVR